MKVTMISREIIKPSYQSTQHLNPHKLCLLDQLFHLTYSTGVLFYPNVFDTNDSNLSNIISKTLTHVKKSLSETLDLYYPFSGRIKDDIFVDDFDAGVPFSEARVESRMSEHLRFGDFEFLNKLLPLPPSCREEANEPIPIPLLAFQANIFSCGGLALGISKCHKISDASSMNHLLSSWAALSRGSLHEVIKPNLSDLSQLFPSENGFSEKLLALLGQTCSEGNYVTKRFLFSSKAVETLRDRARISEDDQPKPTRYEAISCFVLKHVTEAISAVTGSRKAVCIACHAVSIRGKLKFQNPIGNCLWPTTTFAKIDQGTQGGVDQLPKLVGLLREEMKEYESVFRGMAEKDYKEGCGSELLLKKLESLLLSLSAQLDTKPGELGFSNIKGFFENVDFGWGKPFKFEIVGSANSNMVFLADSKGSKGIEATVVLEEKLMAALERDVKFLTFASMNPRMSSL